MSDNIVQITESDMFDDFSYTQGGLSHLMQHLWDQYCLYLNEQIEERKKRSIKTITLEEAKLKATATHFATWATTYLEENRPVENFYIDSNHGIRLANNICVAISAGTVVRGAMQDSQSIPVTEGKSQRDMNGVVPSTSLRI